MPYQLKISSVDQLAAVIGAMTDRIAALERAAKFAGGGAPNWPDGFPTYDPRYVNVDGDTMTGDLIIANPADLNFGSSVRQMLNLYGTSYAHGVQSSTLYSRSASSWSWHRGGVHSDVANDPGAAGVEQMRLTSAALSILTSTLNLYGAGGNTPFIQAFDGTSIASPGSRKGYIGWASTLHCYINNEVPSGNVYVYSGSPGVIILGVGTTETSRVESSGQAWGRTIGTYATANGFDIRTDGRFISTTESTSAYNWFIHIGAKDVGGAIFATFRRGSGTPTQIGTIAQVSTTGVVYNTTSHGPWKGEQRSLDLDAAKERVKRWRPISFRWKHRDGDVTKRCAADGIPSGPVEHGFVAGEMVEHCPQAVTLGHGDESLLDAWWERKRAAEEAGDEFDEPEPFLPDQGDWKHLVPDLSAAVQWLIAKVEQQAVELTTVRAQLATLTGGK